jgi:non-ribosomal peptide synthetase component F
VIGGEALTYEQLRPWHDHTPATEIVNEYGPTETVVGCCVHVMPAGSEGRGAVPIGVATPGTRLAVLDERLRPVPDGEVGELYIGGDQVTRGYLGRPGLTASRYRPDPASPGRRMYRSGDLVRQRPDGTLVYLGRRDAQVKLKRVPDRTHRDRVGPVPATRDRRGRRRRPR